ncbi:N-acetyltransferase [Streptomyces gardneri]|uniref:GNAT family N-acetyltransferase n=1 Tax=Nocardia TaxID=1817 RepID=UPI00135C7AD1|nr:MULTISPECIES: N-acetyltransferase [Nocardia]MBF6163838.1 N-acetyltransferase [Streptomyces gardneri]MBF6203414.1 N-acetyltransferase [Streptomyces gardneri]
MLIRRERADDAAAIAAVHRSAFAPHYARAEHVEEAVVSGNPGSADPPEVGLVAQLRSDEGWIPTLSLVAIEHDSVVGHLCLTRAAVGPFPVLALGPIGVLADHQGAGIGSALMHAALGAADALDEPLIGLLGSLEFYPRFGFVPAARLGITPDDPAWISHFQVRSLSAYDSRIAGEFHYAEPFYTL